MPNVMISSKTCTGCRICELACSAYHEGAYRPSLALLRIEVDPTTTAVKGRTCLQAACAKCQKACPEEAIETQEIEVKPEGLEATVGYVLRVNEDTSTDCGECCEVCPTRVIREHPERKVAVKCDLCDGDPHCVAFCQNPHVLAVSIKAEERSSDKAVRTRSES